MGADAATFIGRWEGSSASEQQTKDQFLLELCELLGVPRPDPASGDPAKDRYVFEYPVRETDAQGQVHTKRVDLYKEGHFLLEAKQGADKGAKKAGTAKRGTNAWHIAMNDAYGQALGYARTLGKPVPILVVCDIGYCFDIYESFDGSGAYRHFPTAQTSRLYLRDLPKHLDTLRRIFVDPISLDPSRKAAKVTREVAGYLANLAKNLEDKGHAQETVARFLMRCLFTMFAEDIELLPDHLFTRLLHEHWIPHPKSFPGGVQSLWETMNTGGDMVLARVRHFNGGLFSDTAALPLDEHALRLLHVAATHDWSDVEPAIFGTLLERALDTKERHRLGAHYTPRAYVERLVRPTIEEPIRADWDVVRAEVAQLRIEEEKAKSDGAKRKKRAEAIKRVRGFHQKLCEIRVLDPACGSGNFLYVALHLFQQIESEIWALLESLGESQDVLRLEGLRVTPAQFLGIEKKRWAKEIAELVLWIGYLQWHYRMLGKKPPVFDPVLHDYQNIENRDALLTYDAEELVVDEKGKPVTRWDGETMKIHPLTKKEVPDEAARVVVLRYENPGKAAWPKADYVIGNPPFIGNWRMRLALGDGYTEALRRVYPEVPETADFVLYWWEKAATLVSQGAADRAGLITTNSITQPFARRVIQRHLEGTKPISLVFAVPDHPWVDSSGSADVRIAMTVTQAGKHDGTVCTIVRETTDADGEAILDIATRCGVVHADLKVGPDVVNTSALQSNSGLVCPGMKLHGAGFIVTREEATRLGLGALPRLAVHIRPYLNGRDLAARSRELYVIDLFGLSENEVMNLFPDVYQWIRERVKPERDANNRAAYRDSWWIFGEPRSQFRPALMGLARYVVTPETSKHRVFQFVDASVLPDNKLIVTATDDGYLLGALSSRVHVTWALAAGGRLGVGNDPVYVKTTCFERFPFPNPRASIRRRIAALAESLDAHRKSRQAAHAGLTITGMYNVLEKLRSGEPLTEKETAIHEKGLVSVLKKIHDDLDAAVFDAYGWPSDLTDEQILEKLVALNAERAEEEKRGIIRWLRPDFQNPTGKREAVQTTIAETDDAETGEASPALTGAPPWPKKMSEQITSVRDTLSGSAGLWTAAQVAAAFAGAKPADVIPVLESLASLGFLLTFDSDDGLRWKAVPPIQA